MFYLILLGTALLAYAPVLFNPNTVNPDAQFIIPSLLDSGNYLKNLFTLNTIDVQPVRDLSLLMDVLIYQLTGLHSMTFHNVILWSLAGFVLFQILITEFHEKWKPKTLLFVCMLFISYPLFSQTVPWGMARKHILSFLFALIAVHQFIKGRKGFTFFYALSVLAQPISLLLPLWALFRSPSRKLIPSFIVMGVLGTVNYLYYTLSPVFRMNYGQKTDEAFDLGEKLLAFGHYLFQLLFPYSLSQVYTLGHWSTIAGLLIALIAAIVLWKFKSRAAIGWIGFAVLPLSIVLVKSTVIYDTYLLLPAVGVLMTGLTLLPPIGELRFRWISLLFLIFFTAFTFRESTFWNSEIKLMERSFDRRPDCLSAIQYLRITYENGERPKSPAAKNFLREYDCRNLQISGQYVVNVEASLMYYEDDEPLEKRISKLELLSKFGIYPQLALAALYIDQDMTNDAREELIAIIDLWQNRKFKPEYIPLVHKTIAPFCEKESIPGCSQLIAPFLNRQSGLSYR